MNGLIEEICAAQVEEEIEEDKVAETKASGDDDSDTTRQVYTMDPGQSNLSQQKEKVFWSKMIFEQKQIRKMHKSCIINA